MIPALVAAYLAAIVAANLSILAFGPEASIVNAFLLVGLVLSTRDRLHDAWRDHLLRNMAGLIVVGSAISYAASTLLADPALPSDVVAKIALASFCAFAVAEAFDSTGYHLLRHRPWLERVNTSNLLAAALDSVIFVAIAFGFDWQIGPVP